VSAHSASQRRGWLSALVAQVSDYVFEPIEETIEPEIRELQPFPFVAVVSAAPRSGATTIARMLAAELASRADGAAVVTSQSRPRRTAPPSRAAIRLATALTGAADAQPLGRLCVVTQPPGAIAAAAAARYLAPVVLDLPADGSAAGVAAVAERIVVVAPAAAEPALLDAVAGVVGGSPVKAANRVTDQDAWAGRADLLLPDSRLAVRAAAMGARPLGALGSAIAALADALEMPR
jgi:hypothetical protein